MKPGARHAQQVWKRILLPWWPPQVIRGVEGASSNTTANKYRSQYRRQCRLLTGEATIAYEGPVPIVVTFAAAFYKQRQRWHCIRAFQAGQEGVAQALGIPEERFEPTYRVVSDKKAARVEVEVLLYDPDR